jgi:hypothetical protein
VRVGVNTGEAVVAVGARTEQGEGIVTGDVVNTAARIQSVAPVNSVAVSQQTYRATSRVFEYEPLAPVSVKGKVKPIRLWRAKAARSRFGSDVSDRFRTPSVGRELEKPLLIGIFERATQQRSVQLVTVVGELGVGKSRLIAELSSYIDTKPGLFRWRQGRCLPYGEGITFWALGEILKAESGILEPDSFRATGHTGRPYTLRVLPARGGSRRLFPCGRCAGSLEAGGRLRLPGQQKMGICRNFTGATGLEPATSGVTGRNRGRSAGIPGEAPLVSCALARLTWEVRFHRCPSATCQRLTKTIERRSAFSSK